MHDDPVHGRSAVRREVDLNKRVPNLRAAAPLVGRGGIESGPPNQLKKTAENSSSQEMLCLEYLSVIHQMKG